MTHLRANSVLSARGDRIAGAWASNLPARERAPAAGVVPLPAPAAFCQGRAEVARLAHNQEVTGSNPVPATNPVAKTSEDNGRTSAEIGDPMAGEVSRGSDATDRQWSALPGFTGEDGGRDVEATGGAASVITLSDHAMILLRAISTYEQVDHADAVTMALATHVTKIGAGPLARACLDEIERCGALTDNRERERVGGGAGGVDACPAGDLAGDDLHAVPEFRRIGENRYRSGGP